MAATEYLFAVQDSGGREVCSWRGAVAKVGDVAAEQETGVVRIKHLGETVVEGQLAAEDTLTLLRWPADDKLAKPVGKPVPHA